MTASNESIKQFILDNPKYLTGHYQELADKFDITYETARHLARRSRPKAASQNVPDVAPLSNKQTSAFKENTLTGEASMTFDTPTRIKTKEDLIALGMLDLNEFDIISYEITTWEGYRKNKSANITWTEGVMDGQVNDLGGMHLETLYRVSVKLQRRKLDKDLDKQKALIMAEIKAQVPSNDLRKDYYKFLDTVIKVDTNTKYLLEICVPDAHFGKFSWKEETGEDFDLKITEERFKSTIRKLLSRVDLSNIARILLPIGNDLINIDNKNHTTTAGTPQDTDSRFMKIIQVVRRVLVEMINELSLIAPVDVLIVRGNHDETSSFMIGEILDAFYHNDPLVYIDNGPKLRKYYQYGETSFQLTHGNEEKHNDLGLIFATEEPQMWAETKYRFSQLGHYHKNKTISYVSVDEHRGFQIQILPSLSSTDSWHYRKGYGSKKQAKAFLYHPEDGLVGEFTVTV